MAKAKTKKTKVTAKKKSFREHSSKGVYWYGIHIHHVGLGVASVGTIVLVLLLGQIR